MRFIPIVGGVLLLLNLSGAAAQEKRDGPPKDKEERVFPSAVSDVCVGGGGRFLILHLPKERKLAVFDANEAKVVKYLPAAAEDIKFAAGMDKLLVAVPGDKAIQRWSLKTFEREETARTPVAGAVTALCMGSASHGPLYVGTSLGPDSGAAHFLDPATLKPINVKVAKGQLPGHGVFVRASADGTMFTMRNGVGGEPHTISTLVFKEKSVAVNEHWIPGSVLVPSLDGRYVHTSGAVYTDRMELFHPKELPKNSARSYLPSSHGPYYMRLDFKQWDKLGGTLNFFLEGTDRPFALLANVEGVSNEQIAYGKNRDKLTPDQRVFFIPDAKLVVTIPDSDDRLILHRFDVEKGLEQSGLDYLVVTSRPMARAVKGETYRYEIAVKSKKGGVKYTLEAGPDGMKFTADGRLTWDVPKNFAEATVNVTVKVSDSAGQEVFHTFKVAVKDKADAPR